MTDEQIADLAEQALNAACVTIQDKLNIETGDFAGLYFSGNHPIYKMLTDYIRSETQQK